MKKAEVLVSKTSMGAISSRVLIPPSPWKRSPDTPHFHTPSLPADSYGFIHLLEIGQPGPRAFDQSTLRPDLSLGNRRQRWLHVWMARCEGVPLPCPLHLSTAPLMLGRIQPAAAAVAFHR